MLPVSVTCKQGSVKASSLYGAFCAAHYDRVWPVNLAYGHFHAIGTNHVDAASPATMLDQHPVAHFNFINVVMLHPHLSPAFSDAALPAVVIQHDDAILGATLALFDVVYQHGPPHWCQRIKFNCWDSKLLNCKCYDLW